ncbi:hypothetical protein IDM40_00600 [Nocardiopsis sp. HNM0947]|uniref:DUF6879 domain-containing protein n=1 Tax=Nocardiopsis coralli TaxID=2772213 RepID=A0ABR9P036_9ACTN|nr:DUF6879 family protein [Nocardiopsis coralli]MBE2997205.1 hypothetical protein [Nocardiopsis coralli]
MASHLATRATLLTVRQPSGMSFDDVLTHTGISSRTLTSLVEHDRIRRSRDQPALFSTPSVLEHMFAGPPRTVFDLLNEAARNGQHLIGKDAARAHEHACSRAHLDGMPTRIVRRTSAPPEPNTAWGCWYRGDRAGAGEHLTVQQGIWARREKTAALSPPRWRRTHVLWISPAPLSPWGRYLAEEMESRVRAGQRVKAVPTDTVRPLETTCSLPEVDVYASGTILIRQFTGVGADAGLIYLYDQRLARALIRVVRALMGSGEPLRTFIPRALRGTPHRLPSTHMGNGMPPKDQFGHTDPRLGRNH